MISQLGNMSVNLYLLRGRPNVLPGTRLQRRGQNTDGLESVKTASADKVDDLGLASRRGRIKYHDQGGLGSVWEF